MHHYTDAVWGDVLLPAWVHRVMASPEFARLRDLKQTGALDYVLPAKHSRFEHSVGTACCALRLMGYLRAKDPAIEPRHEAMVVLAALCHDMGHGPGSHSFEEVMAAVGHSEWKHEAQTLKMVRHMVGADPELAAVLAAVGVDVDVVCSMIVGKCPPEWPSRMSYLCHLVSDPHSGLDVDKLDYIARDCLVLGLGAAEDLRDVWDVVLRTCKPLPVQGFAADCRRLSWPVACATEVHTVFRKRAELHEGAYQLPRVRAAQAMVNHVMGNVAHWPLLRRPDGTLVSLVDAALDADPSTFVTATDRFIEQVLSVEQRGLSPKSSTVCARLRAGDLWALVSERAWDVQAAASPPSEGERQSAQDAGVQAAKDSGLTVAFTETVTVHGGKGLTKSPVALVPFFDADDAVSARLRDDLGLDVLRRAYARVYVE